MIQVIDDIRQKHVEAFFRTMRERGVKTDEYFVPEYHGEVVRAAAAAGLLTKPLEGSVEEWVPWLVRKVAQEINKRISEALTIPPD